MKDAGVRIFAVASLMVCLLAAPLRAHAGVGDFLNRAAAVWRTMAIGAQGGPADEGGGGPEGADDSTPHSVTTSTPGLCQAPQEPPRVECEVGSGFLCVSTPPGGVDGASFVLRGTIDRNSSVLAGIAIAAQSDYTKRITAVDTSSPATAGCWGPAAGQSPFCIDAEGRFSARVELPEAGPYTVSVAASRVLGDSAERKVRISRVKVPSLDASSVELDPDVRAAPSTDASHVRVSVSLLSGCQFCDFIGASTNGVEVSVENVITGPDGNTRRVECASTVEQGGQGLFSIGVPVGAGQNSLTIRACNAAVEGACPSVGPVSFQGTGPGETVDGITFLSPEPLPSYDMDRYPAMHWKFRIAGETGCVDVRFNRDAPIGVCPDPQGAYSLTLNPRVGINVATIAAASGMEEFAWTFGWGKILSPHAGGGAMDVPSAVEIAIPSRTARVIVLPFINNFLASDERDALIGEMLSGMGGGGGQDGDGNEIAVPKCSSAGIEGFTAELRGSPALGEALIKGLEFGEGTMALAASLKDAEIGIDLVPDKDLPPLPLIISFRKALLDISLEQADDGDGMPMLLLSSPHDDCDYKAGSYCKHIPAALIPENIVGGANSWGGFVRCDMDLAKGKAKEACAAINSLNAQTGVINEKVLDSLNEAIYCGGSAALTGLLRDGAEIPALSIGSLSAPAGRRGGRGVTVPLGLMPGSSIDLFPSGVLADAGLAVGAHSIYSHTPAWAKIPSAGIIRGEGFGERSFATPSDAAGDAGVSVALDAAGALIFAATAQGDGRAHRGLLDVDVHELFFEGMGFDFVEECDAFEPGEGNEDKPTLCHIRPRVSEMFGTALTTYGYLQGSHPLMIAVRANRALGARVAAVEPHELPPVAKSDGGEAAPAYEPRGPVLSVELGGLSLSFYALEIDPSVEPDRYGNPAVQVGADGTPVIRSMRPSDPDPWNGQVISLDMTLLAAVEIGEPLPDPSDESAFALPLRILADRTRLVLTPMPGSNATTVPASSLVSQLSEKLSLALSAFSADGEPIMIPVPATFEFERGGDGLLAKLGLAAIALDRDGISLELEPETSSVSAAAAAIITQILHVEGKQKTYTLPD
ncbi:MAG: hypothetical protein JXA24_02645 [Proteobacteria bacterium]|nr:hypothetical protein [Pseudomonadota bacterium]